MRRPVKREVDSDDEDSDDEDNEVVLVDSITTTTTSSKTSTETFTTSEPVQGVRGGRRGGREEDFGNGYDFTNEVYVKQDLKSASANRLPTAHVDWLAGLLRYASKDKIKDAYKETFCDAIDEFKRMGWFTGNEVRWSELLADMAVSVRQLAEIEVSEEEDLYLAGECCVSVRNIVEFFPDVSDAITLSQNIDVLRFFGGRRGFHVRAPTKSELGTSLLKRVAESLGLQGRVWDKTSTNFVKDIDMLQEALTTYNDIERDSGTGHKRLMKGHKCSEHDIGGEVRDINGCTHKTTWQNNHMTSHKATNHKTGGLVCGIDGCQHRTGNSMDMKRHKLSKHGFGPGHGRKRFHCDVPGCSSSYLRESRLRDHKAKKHSIGVTPDKVSCTVLGCSKTFCSKAEMVRHVKAKHSGGCNFSTSITSNLRRHKKNVHGM
ncbi:hypothetical protein TrLO_g15007 [Triparma laevis f. longispina]|uniref:C2H2-type domain-containing protein n=1 Tax=Triparma laevis f. longispina TaxID=1714387 RepID=A0A9W7CAZ6_9STRA|nr:hypothetical protein TrLO_g15007 [Triparma laevis f. longispina]